MAKRWSGYVDPSKNKRFGLVQSAGVVEFDTEKMTPEDKELLEAWETGEHDFGEDMIDSIYPTKIYFSIDNLNQVDIKQKYSLNIDGYEWPVSLQDIFTNLKEAWAKIEKEKLLVFKEIFESKI